MNRCGLRGVAYYKVRVEAKECEGAANFVGFSPPQPFKLANIVRFSFVTKKERKKRKEVKRREGKRKS